MSDYSPTGFWAYFKRPEPTDDQPFWIVPVQRFTDAGEPLVFLRDVDKTKLLPANQLSGYHGLGGDDHDRAQTGGRKLIGAVTAQPGWFIKTGDDVHRVEAWGVLDNGELVPIDDFLWDEEGNRLHMHWIDQDLTKEAPYYTLHRFEAGLPES
jgi:hypothetical protein